jgi:lauroyl/myristoyl acyltransferase
MTSDTATTAVADPAETIDRQIQTLDSIGDLDVVVRNAEVYRLLSRQPPEWLHSMLVGGVSNERHTVLARRVEPYRRIAFEQFERIPALRAEASDLAERWADYRLLRNAYMLSVILQIRAHRTGNPAVEVVGQGFLDKLRESGHPILFVSAHYAAYQAIPVALVSLGFKIAFLMEGAARALADPLLGALVPNVVDSLSAVSVDDPGATRILTRHLGSGEAALMFPEFGLSRSQRRPTTPFFGRSVYMPRGPEVISRLSSSAVVPIVLEIKDSRPVLTIDRPIYEPGEQNTRGVVTGRYFDWLETLVRRDPASWWCWEIFEQYMAAD